MGTGGQSTSGMLETMVSISPLSKQYQVIASPNCSGEQADRCQRVLSNGDCRTISTENAWKWGLQDHQHRECLKISPHAILPAIGFHRPPESNHHSYRRSFQWAVCLTLLYSRETFKSESKYLLMALDIAKKEHGSISI